MYFKLEYIKKINLFIMVFKKGSRKVIFLVGFSIVILDKY